MTTRLEVIEGGKSDRPRFYGEGILQAAADFVDERLPNLIDEQRITAVLGAARVIVDAEHEF